MRETIYYCDICGKQIDDDYNPYDYDKNDNKLLYLIRDAVCRLKKSTIDPYNLKVDVCEPCHIIAKDVIIHYEGMVVDALMGVIEDKAEKEEKINERCLCN
jgi:hypothetical protein